MQLSEDAQGILQPRRHFCDLSKRENLLPSAMLGSNANCTVELVKPCVSHAVELGVMCAQLPHRVGWWWMAAQVTISSMWSFFCAPSLADILEKCLFLYFFLWKGSRGAWLLLLHQLRLCFALRALTAPAALRIMQVPKFCSSVKRSEWYFLQQHMVCVSTWFQLYKLAYFMAIYLFENFSQTAGKVLQTHCEALQPQSSSAGSREWVCLWLRQCVAAAKPLRTAYLEVSLCCVLPCSQRTVKRVLQPSACVHRWVICWVCWSCLCPFRRSME